MLTSTELIKVRDSLKKLLTNNETSYGKWKKNVSMRPWTSAPTSIQPAVNTKIQEALKLITEGCEILFNEELKRANTSARAKAGILNTTEV